MKNAKPNWTFLIGITFLCGFCTQTLGEALAANGSAYDSLFTKPDYLKDKTAN
jgi:hypothetical protein